MIIGPGTRPRSLATENLSLYAAGQKEVALLLSPFAFGALPKLTPEKARELLQMIDDMARRDPLSPWFCLVRAYLLQQSNDPGAAAAFRDVLQSPGGDFSEWLPISAALTRAGQIDFASATYERGYKDYLQHGYDPRLMQSTFLRRLLFPSAETSTATLAEIPADEVERVYRVAPYDEYAWINWDKIAERRRQQGRADQAQLWRARGRDAQQNSPELMRSFGVRFDALTLVLLASSVAALIFVFTVNHRYAAQRQVDIEAGRRKWAIPLVSNLSYWTRTQRFAVVLLVLIGWSALGLAGIYAAGFLRSFERPVTLNETYAGPIVRGHFQSLPPSPERDVLLAMSYQQSGDSRRAEDLYRKLPQFGASWNNLGVLLKRRGHDEEAKEAFKRALQVDPQLHEAAFNLDGSTPDLWTELHKQYVPERPMLAIAPPQVVRAAYRGGSSRSFYFWSALRGPFWPANAYLAAIFDIPIGRSESLMRGFSELIALGSLLVALVLLFSRRRVVTEGAGPRQWMAELVFPGTSPIWNVLGGVVLTAWLACWIGLVLLVVRHSPWLITASLMRSFGGLKSGALNPSWSWFVLAIAVISAINAAIVMRKRSTLDHTASAASAQ